MDITPRTLLALMLVALATISAQAKGFVTHCTVTTYNATCSQCDDTPCITADGTRISHEDVKSGKQRIIAVSRELLCWLPYGSIVEVEGHGRYVVADLMHKRFNHYVDILIHDNQHFKKRNVKITLIKNGKSK